MASKGVDLIAKERARQVICEGWTAKHDDKHMQGELAWAAVCYAAPGRVYSRVYINDGGGPCITFNDPWPWDPVWDKRAARTPVFPPCAEAARTLRLRDLVKAGALIGAEIDRLLREQEAEDHLNIQQQRQGDDHASD